MSPHPRELSSLNPHNNLRGKDECHHSKGRRRKLSQYTAEGRFKYGSGPVCCPMLLSLQSDDKNRNLPTMIIIISPVFRTGKKTQSLTTVHPYLVFVWILILILMATI